MADWEGGDENVRTGGCSAVHSPLGLCFATGPCLRIWPRAASLWEDLDCLVRRGIIKHGSVVPENPKTPVGRKGREPVAE